MVFIDWPIYVAFTDMQPVWQSLEQLVFIYRHRACGINRVWGIHRLYGIHRICDIY